MDYESSITDIEAKIAFQEDLLQQLDEVVARQDTQIGLLKAQIEHLSETVKDLRFEIKQGTQQGGGEEQERPPHY